MHRIGGLTEDDFKEDAVLHKLARRTLGYEVWMDEFRDSFRKRLLQTLNDRIHKLGIPDRFRELDKKLCTHVAKMLRRAQGPAELNKALLIRAKYEEQAEEVVRYLEGAEVALGLVRKQESDHHTLARRARVPAIKRYHARRAAYADCLKRWPGKPFYPGRPRRRKIDASWSWYPPNCRRRNAARGLPWRPVRTPWADAGRRIARNRDWNDLDALIAQRAASLPKRKADQLDESTKGALPPRKKKAPPPAPPSTTKKVGVARQTDKEEGKRKSDDWNSDDSLFNEKPVKPDPATKPAGDKPGKNDKGRDLPSYYGSKGAGETKPEHIGHDKKKEGKVEKKKHEPVKASKQEPFRRNNQQPAIGNTRQPATGNTQRPTIWNTRRPTTWNNNQQQRAFRPLESQNTSYVPNITWRRLPRVTGGGASWRTHYEELETRVADATASGHWENLDDPTAAQAVADICARAEALEPAAEKFLNAKNPSYALGYDDWGGVETARYVALEFLSTIYHRVEGIRSFQWRSARDHAVGIERVDDRGSDGVGFKGDFGVI